MRYVIASLGLLVIGAGLAAQDQPQYETTEIADGVYQFRWGVHNGLFMVTSGGVVVMDPINAEAAAVFAQEIKRIAPGQPLKAIVYSHHHVDHASGANVMRDAFEEFVPIIAHADAASKIAEANSENQPAPDVTFSKEMTLHFGGRDMELRFLGKSHSDNLIVALIPDTRTLFAVDFISRDRVGFRDLQSHYFPDFFDTVRGVLELDFDTIVYGHGPAGDKASVERQLAYYEALRDAVAKAIDDGLTEDQAAEQVTLAAYGDWGAYEQWFALNVRGIYRWLKDQP